MEIRLINKEKDTMEIEVIGEDETLLEPLKQKLLERFNLFFEQNDVGKIHAGIGEVIIMKHDG